MSRKSNYRILEDVKGRPLLIEDVGPWNVFMSVTNNAEAVVEELVGAGKLPEGRRLLYIDSDGQMDEIVISGGKFLSFKPAPGSRR